MTMKQQIKELIVSSINQWTDPDIYVVSLFVYDDGDNPSKPTVTLGYNTESRILHEYEWEKRYRTENNIRNLPLPSARELRWNYAYWLQNEFFRFGVGETAAVVREWLAENHFPYREADPTISEWEIVMSDEMQQITQAFVRMLVSIVQELHQEGVLTRKFGKELPILIHELEYYEEIAEQNIEANGRELVEDFVLFCLGIED